MDADKHISIEVTLDGSTTIYVPSLDEHYHSVNGARQESDHVFINAGFRNLEKDDIRILEIGFGTGLNAYLTYLDAESKNKNIDYVGIELFPLSRDIIEALNYAKEDTLIHQNIFDKIHQSEWGQAVPISDFFVLTKLQSNFANLELNFDDKFDLLYFDAFAPDKQAEMWTKDIFQYLYDNTREGGILTTYCAKGVVRRTLQEVGFKVERLSGPPGKREMLRATKF